MPCLFSASPRVVNINVPGPYSLVWILAYATFVLQLVIALSCEQGEDSPAISC